MYSIEFFLALCYVVLTYKQFAATTIHFSNKSFETEVQEAIKITKHDKKSLHMI